MEGSHQTQLQYSKRSLRAFVAYGIIVIILMLVALLALFDLAANTWKIIYDEEFVGSIIVGGVAYYFRPEWAREYTE